MVRRLDMRLRETKHVCTLPWKVILCFLGRLIESAEVRKISMRMLISIVSERDKNLVLEDSANRRREQKSERVCMIIAASSIMIK